MKNVLLIFLVFLSLTHFSQKDYGREIVNILASDAYYGRGYVNKGDKLAANFLVKEFKKLGAQPIGDSYLQEYTLPVNTFPGKVEVIVGDKTLKTGKDFIISPNSGSAKGEYNLVILGDKEINQLLNKFDTEGYEIDAKTAYLVEFSKPADQKERQKQYYLKQFLANLAPVLIINNEKYTWSVAKEALKFPIIQIQSQLIDQATTVRLTIENKFIESYKTQNVIGIIPAKRKCKRNKYVFFTAHYDHLGMMGNTATMNGANDNASGTAMMLSLMKYYSKHKPEYNMVFIGFGAEEAGLVGSKFFVDNPLVPLDKIKFLVNVDLMGTGESGITVVNATEHEKEFKWLEKINKRKKLLKVVKKRGKAANSDHYWFEEQGVPSFFIYAMGDLTHYHDIMDRPETLPLSEFDDLQTLIIKFVKKF